MVGAAGSAYVIIPDLCASPAMVVFMHGNSRVENSLPKK